MQVSQMQLSCLLLPLLLCGSYCGSGSYNSSRAVSYMPAKPQNAQHLQHLLRRQRRWLTFELGSSLGISCNCVKAILPNVPANLLVLAEFAYVFELPSAIEDWLPRRKSQPKPKSAVAIALPRSALVAAKTRVAQPVILPLHASDPVQRYYAAYPQGKPTAQSRRFSYEKQLQRGCPAAHLASNKYGNYYCRPSAAQSTLRRRLRRQLQQEGVELLGDQQHSADGMLFDLLTLLSLIQGHQPRYCIMRTLCEARHLIAPLGTSLFHDMFRIMLQYVQPEIAQQRAYREAFTAGHRLHACASLYGPHCRESFLLHFSQLFQREFAAKF